MSSLPRVDPASAPLGPTDWERLAEVEVSLKVGLELKRWWERATGPWAGELSEDKLARLLRAEIHPYLFRTTRPSKRWFHDLGYGFFDTATIAGRQVPVEGIVQQQFFDRLKITAPVLKRLEVNPEQSETVEDRALESWYRSLRAFVLEHFQRVSGFESSYAPAYDPDQRPIAPYLRWISGYPERDSGLRRGFNYSQIYYKRRNGQVGKFRQVDQDQIDPRSLYPGGEFSWLVFHFDTGQETIDLAPWGKEVPFLVLPFHEETLVVTHREFALCDHPQRSNSPEGGRYGLGHAFLETSHRRFDEFGFRDTHFLAKCNGRVLVQHIVVRVRANNLTSQILGPLLRTDRFTPTDPPLVPGSRVLTRLLAELPEQLGVDPVTAATELASLATGGQSVRELGLSRQRLEELLLIGSAIRNMRSMDEVGWIWRSVPDWAKTEDLPGWASLRRPPLRPPAAPPGC